MHRQNWQSSDSETLPDSRQITPAMIKLLTDSCYRSFVEEGGVAKSGKIRVRI
jgi:hypothetical protein